MVTDPTERKIEMLTDEQRKEIDRIMRAIESLALQGVEIEASITYEDGIAIVNETYDSKIEDDR